MWWRLHVFAGCRSGTVMALCSIASGLMIASVGLAVDYSIYLAARSRLMGAVEASALAAARRRVEMLADAGFAALSQSQRDAETIGFARNYIFSMTGDIGRVQVVLSQTPDVTIDDGLGRVTITATALFTPVFAAVLSVEPWTVLARAAAEIEPRDLNLAVAIDVSAAMGSDWGGGPKLNDLKDQLPGFLEAISQSSAVQQRKIALLPFAGAVNAGSFAASVAGTPVEAHPSGAACVHEREAGLIEQPYDTAPDAMPLRYPSEVHPTVAAAVDCPGTAVLPLRDYGAEITDALAGLSSSGSLAGHLGFAWTYYALSERWNGVWPGYGAKTEAHRVAVVVVGGEFTAAGTSSPATMAADSLQATAETCTAMKNSDITVVTLIFATAAEIAQMSATPSGSSSSTYETVKACASGADNSFVVSDTYELTLALKAIGAALTSTRLVE